MQRNAGSSNRVRTRNKGPALRVEVRVCVSVRVGDERFDRQNAQVCRAFRDTGQADGKGRDGGQPDDGTNTRDHVQAWSWRKTKQQTQVRGYPPGESHWGGNLEPLVGIFTCPTQQVSNQEPCRRGRRPLVELNAMQPRRRA